ncbi:MAG: CYTH domain-containing protein [Desulfovibrio sp.]|jgi:CYTH domain-containing protein|nr:CYTH domain-containing protein [Desulfovibrio sp.]
MDSQIGVGGSEAGHLEIERKFLPAGESWRGLASGRPIRQGYLCLEPERTVRVRMSCDRACLAIKGKNRGAARIEFEYPISLPDAEYMLEHLALRPLVEKLRYSIPFAGLVWEVDEFLGENSGLVLIEVEIASEDAEFVKPDWAGVEVTGDTRFYNANLVQRPFKTFGC